jgi:arylsulfatase A-like enzyme
MQNISRRDFHKLMGLGAATLTFPVGMTCQSSFRRPNIVYILTDDLGYGELGCYGQQKIRTPNIDRLAAEGMRFTQHYSGSPVCAPSRCTLLTGKHTGHSYIRDNDEMGERGDVWHDPNLEGQRPLLPSTETVGTMLRREGYITACIGKWGLGGPGSTGHPNKQGFDHYYGYLCQRVAHNYYPTHLWRNEEKHILEGNEYFFPHQRLPEDKDPHDPASYASYSGEQYAPDLMVEEALGFIRSNKDNPFFLYFATPVPHVSLQVPEDSLDEYEGSFPETPYRGEKGYVPHIAPRAAYAAMITRMDRDVGRIMALLEDLGMGENTLVIFSSDNGPTYAGGVDYDFFESAGPLRGLKGSVFEGGIRVPMIARWPGKVKAGTRTDHTSAFWDVMPTLAEIVGAQTLGNIDGVSFLPTLLGKGNQKKHEYLYWEYFGRPSQAVRMGDWKGIRLDAKEDPDGPVELYNLSTDMGEEHNVAAEHPEIVREIESIMASRTPSGFARWNFREVD